MKPFLILIAVLGLLYPAVLLAGDTQDSTEESSFEKFLKRLYDNEERSENRVTLNGYYGFTIPSFADGIFGEELSNTYSAEISYGFTRFFEVEENERIFRHASEWTFLKNISSHFKPESIEKKGITTDTWSFGFGISDGYGYNLNENRLMLLHTGAFVWSRVDVELDAAKEKDNELLEVFDEEFHFGTLYSGAIRYRISGSFHMDAAYEHTLVYQDFDFLKWFGAWMIDNVSQRWIDYFEPELLKKNHEAWPWMKFLFKNAISLVVYELRRNGAYWPFKSKEPLNFDTFKIGVSFVF